MNKKLLPIFLGCLVYTNSYSGGGVESFYLQTPYMLGNSANQSKVSTETIFSNPAGISFLEKGEYLSLGTLIVQPEYENNIGGLKAETNTIQGIPSFSYVNVRENHSYYLGFGFIGQGGILKYDVSPSILKDLRMDLIHPGGIFGVSKKFNDTSISIGGRFLYSKIKVEGKIPLENSSKYLESEIEGWGITPEIGVHHRVNSKIDLAVKYQWRMKIDYNGKVKKGNEQIVSTILPKYSKDQRKDFPSALSLGGNYKIDSKNTLFLGYNLIGESDNKSTYGPNYKDIYEYSIGFERVINDKNTVVLSYTYSDRNCGDKPISGITDLDSHHIGMGLEYKKNSDLTIIGSVGAIIYEKETSNLGDMPFTSERKELILGIGFTKKIK